MEWESYSLCHSHTYPRWCSSWELECRDWSNPQARAAVDAERSGGCEGGDCGGKMPMEESWAAMEARRYCWVTCREWSHHHSLSPLTRQHWQLNSREAGPSKGGHWTTERSPTQGTTLSDWCAQLQRKTPRQGSPPSAWTGGATKKDWPKRPSDHQLQEAWKKTDRAIAPAAEAARVPAHLALPGSPQAKQLHHLHAQLSLGQSCHGQKSLAPKHTESLR